MKRTASLPKGRRPVTRPAGTLRIAMLAYPGVQVLDVMGPLEVFSRAERWMRDEGHRADHAYTVEIVAPRRGAFRTSSGLTLLAEHGIADVRGTIDTLLIAGGVGVADWRDDAALLRWVRRQAGSVRRLASVCTGAFILAGAGLLDGRRATTHWGHCDQLARDFPGVAVEPDTIFIREGSLYTSAGVTAGMDLALALVEEDHGREVALAVARQLVLFLRRPGGQAQFSAQMSVQLSEHQPLRELQTHILEHPGEDHSIAKLARRVAMSPRNFARVFRREIGMTPAGFVTSVRVETARRMLEDGNDSLETVSARSGLGSTESLRRAFLRIVGVSPSRYRERFHRPESAEAPRRAASANGRTP